MPVKKRLDASRRRSAGFPILSHRILNLANRGVLRPQFQQEVSRMILGFSGCDAVELWLKDRGKYYREEVKRRSRPSPPVEVDHTLDHETDGCLYAGISSWVGSVSPSCLPVTAAYDQDICKPLLPPKRDRIPLPATALSSTGPRILPFGSIKTIWGSRWSRRTIA
jgi:hypothetical protein